MVSVFNDDLNPGRQEPGVPDILHPGTLIYTLLVLSLTFGLISVMATLFAFYWFVKMRRSFRHDLIMLLIQSDFIKALWFTLFPIVNLVKGRVQSDSAFCQASGFFLTWGIESSDVAVLLIAIHSVMYIFRPRSGLYPYRRYAYAVWVLFPLTIASLAFANGSGYENVGHYCYLKTERHWARVALSWIPRYLICGLILVLYIFVYAYVRRKIDRYGRRSSTTPRNSRQREREELVGVPPTPPIAYHGLLPSTPNSRRGSAVDAKEHQRSMSSISTVRFDEVVLQQAADYGHAKSSRARRPVPINWTWAGFNETSLGSPSSAEERLLDEGEDPLSPVIEGLVAPPPTRSPNSPRKNASVDETALARDLARSQSFWHRRFGSGSSEPVGIAGQPRTRVNTAQHTARLKDSLPNIFAILRVGPERDPNESGRTESGASIFLSTTGVNDMGVARNRDKIRRQLRSLFVYPLAYMITWLFPFISHIRGYDDSLTKADPSWLLIVSIISLCIQGTVDCIMFTTREKPWVHSSGGFWTSIQRRLTVDKRRTGGRTREEMLVDGRLARARRDEEVAAERVLHGSISAGVPRPRKRGREWWDAEVDGPMDYDRERDDCSNSGSDETANGSGSSDSSSESVFKEHALDDDLGPRFP